MIPSGLSQAGVLPACDKPPGAARYQPATRPETARCRPATRSRSGAAGVYWGRRLTERPNRCCAYPPARDVPDATIVQLAALSRRLAVTAGPKASAQPTGWAVNQNPPRPTPDIPKTPNPPSETA
jgi:hypothetical protein